MEYEELVKMMGFISAATDIGFSRDDDLPMGILNDLTDIRNRINRQRLSMLGNDQERPYNVADIVGPV